MISQTHCPNGSQLTMSQAQESQALYEQANAFLQKGQLANAEPLYLQLIDALPAKPRTAKHAGHPENAAGTAP